MLIILGRLQVFWFENDHPKIMNSLQFAAKVHELLILASLSAMILEYTRRLISVDGLPFGLLSAVHRGADINLLRESAFWWSICQKKKSTLALGIILVFSALLSVLVGPSSAIAFIPTAGWYNFPGAFTNTSDRINIRSPDSTDSNGSSLSKTQMSRNLWITPLNENSIDGINGVCSQPEDLTCPGRVTPQLLLDLVGTYRTTTPRNGSDEPFAAVNRTYDSPAAVNYSLSEIEVPGAAVLYPIVSEIVNDTAGNQKVDRPVAVTAASTPSSFLMRSMASVWRLIERRTKNFGPIMNTMNPRFSVSPKSDVYQPVVQAQCYWFGTSSDINNSTQMQLVGDGMLTFDNGLGWRLADSAAWVVPKDLMNNIIRDRTNFSSTAFDYEFGVDWIEAEDVNAPGKFSISAIVSIPFDMAGELQRPSSVGLIPCVFNAYWMPTNITFDPHSQRSFATTWTSYLSTMAAAVQQAHGGHPPGLPAPLDFIQIDGSWANLLNMPTIFQMIPVYDSSYPNPAFLLQDPSHKDSRMQDYISAITVGINAAMAAGIANYGIRPLMAYERTADDGRRTTIILDHDGFLNGLEFDEQVESSPGDDDASSEFGLYDVRMVVERYGYASGARTETIQFAFAILYIYLLVFLFYWGFAIYYKFIEHRPSIYSWSSVQDLLALALNSPPPEDLENCGAGIKKRNIWRKHVKIRADADNRLAIVFG